MDSDGIQRIDLLSRLVEAEFFDEGLYANVLPRSVGWERHFVFWRKVKRRNVLRLLDPPLDDEFLPPFPRGALKQLMFAVDAYMSKLPVRDHPRVVELAAEDVGTKDVGDRPEKVLANDGVLRRDNMQRRVLMADAFDDRKNGSEVVDVGGVRPDGARERLGLVASLSFS